MQGIDRSAIEGTGVPGEVLMALAGKAVADRIIADLPGIKSASVCAGTGNNGGDGFVIAYLLANRGIPVKVFLAGEKARVSKTSAIFLNACVHSGISIEEVTDGNSFRASLLEGSDLVVDALAGTGFTGAPRGLLAAAIAAVNGCGARVVSVDVPSGLPSDGEAPGGEAVRADLTVTIGLPKISLVTWPGRSYAGELHVADIGFPRALTQSDELRTALADASFARPFIASAKDGDFHKGAAGHLLLAGGFDGMEGAIIMTAQAAFETGVGLATLLTTPGARAAVAGAVPELITRSLDFPPDAATEEGAQERILENAARLMDGDRRYAALVIGPGMGRGAYARMVFEALILACGSMGIRRALIDGDGLFHLADFLKTGKLPSGTEFVITPHFLEASRLLDMPVDEIKNDRFSAARLLATRTGCTALLKGPGTIIHDGKNALVNTSGGPALATAGSGDVLSGIVGALLLRDMTPLEAAGLGAYLHGLAADMCCTEQGLEVMKATDGVRFIRRAMASLVQSHE